VSLLVVPKFPRQALNVCFGNRQNYRREKLDFEVMDWPSQYHAILRRPMFLRFIAVPHYTYLVLKVPRPNGIITVKEASSYWIYATRNFTRWPKTS
jgi:hypothetical protein